VSESLERLLNAEQRARRLVDDALAERDRILERARHEAEDAERQFGSHMVELRHGLLAGAEKRAAQRIGEMEREFAERGGRQREQAGMHRDDALEAAVELLTDATRL
jgi:vacuolar-type H+-ATPase subunit H